MRGIVLFCAVAFIAPGAPGAEPGQKLVLEPGVGIAGLVEIGRPVALADTAQQALRDLGLDWKTEGETGRVIIVFCSEEGCLTDRNVGIGTSVERVYRRYGNPRARSTGDSEAALLQYDGVAFEVEDRRVAAIYIYGRSAAAR